MTVNPEWKQFERLVAAIHHAESQGALVTWNDTIQGRQFDVTIRFKYGLHDYLTVIECKNYSDRVTVEKVDAFVTKARDAKANKAIIVSVNGYQSGCFEVAIRHGVKLLTLNETIKTDVKELVAEVTPALNVYDVRLVNRTTGKEIILEDEGGRLHYLMNHTKLESKGETKSPNQLIYEWQLSTPKLYIDSENIIAIQLPEETMAHIPHESSQLVEEFRFKCKVIEAFISKQPFLDNHIREGCATSYELCDETGAVTHEIRLSDLKLGFDTKLEPGKFYVTPSLHNYYYCEKIDGDSVSWILVESYQHGHLLRAHFIQDIKYSHHYVEVKDKKRIARLLKLLEELRGFKS